MKEALAIWVAALIVLAMGYAWISFSLLPELTSR